MRASRSAARHSSGRNLLWDLLTFERLLTGPVVHLIYWCGLGLLALSGFTVVGAAIGVAIRGGSWEGLLLAGPVAVGGLLVLAAAALLWRGACEFFVAIFQIADDLHALRLATDADPAPSKTPHQAPGPAQAPISRAEGELPPV